MPGLSRLAARGLLAGALLASVGGCGPRKPTLTGSLSQYFSLTFTRHEVLRTHNAFQITYYNLTQVEEDVVARITVVTTGYDFTPGHSYDLSGEYAPGHPRCVVSHAAGNEPPRTLPPVLRGKVTLDQGGKLGEQTEGSFSLAFGQGGDFGDGRDIGGDFAIVSGGEAF
jgi:hypothetical protein